MLQISFIIHYITGGTCTHTHVNIQIPHTNIRDTFREEAHICSSIFIESSQAYDDCQSEDMNI